MLIIIIIITATITVLIIAVLIIKIILKSWKLPTFNSKVYTNHTYSITENDIDPQNVIQSKYYDVDELQQLKISNKEKALSFSY